MFKHVQERLAPNQRLIERNERVVQLICLVNILYLLLQQSELPSTFTEEITQLRAKMGTRRCHTPFPAAVVCRGGANPISNLLLCPMVSETFFDQLPVGNRLGSFFHAIAPSFSRADSLLPCRHLLDRR